MPRYAARTAALPAKVRAPASAAPRRSPGPQQRPPLWHVLQLRAAQSARADTASAAPSREGLPAALKAGIEGLSGIAMDDVRVHRNSAEPAKIGALAYAQGSDIHLGVGQEAHLPHEAWHVVQQKLGRVRATRQMKGGLALNDDAGLEREADAMGARAAAAPPGVRRADSLSAAAVPPVRGAANGAIVQAALAKVDPQNGPVALEQSAGGLGGRLVVMKNSGQAVGKEVVGSVGLAGVLDPDKWDTFGRSPTKYWRAHAYAESFGGAGDQGNVAWWPEADETTWTAFEQQVRGAGLAQIANWLPGIGEKGTYLVERELHQAVQLKAGYVGPLIKAMNWGFDDARAAWTRAIATCDGIQDQIAKNKRIDKLKAAKDKVKNKIQPNVDKWIGDLFGQKNLEGNLIKKMTMTYTITNAGAGAGATRANVTESVSAAAPNPDDFGLKDNQEQAMWKELVNQNVGMFAAGPCPIKQMKFAVGYDEDKNKPAQMLTGYADGWGETP
jgi:hypothetical protein